MRGGVGVPASSRAGSSGAPAKDRELLDLLERLEGDDRARAWSVLLERMAPLVLQVVGRQTRGEEECADCFVYACEQLARDDCRRLRRYRRAENASFDTWLRVVVRRLCVDWLRQRLGSRRPFRELAELSAFDLEVYRLVYEQGLGRDDAAAILEPSYPRAGAGAVERALERIERRLGARHHWLLSAWSLRASRPAPLSMTDPQIAHADPDPEMVAVRAELGRRLQRALAALPAADRLLLRLRYERGMALREIAELLDLGNPQRVDRRVRAVLDRLRDALDAAPDVADR
ncbi:MAG TPA: sigma-70 family RNA polymerase sigma factor [Planctomycetota bacterium]|nr:sigma-70 family RNA polymerase sigma factor [Planctomycetota bacterium]